MHALRASAAHAVRCTDCARIAKACSSTVIRDKYTHRGIRHDGVGEGSGQGRKVWIDGRSNDWGDLGGGCAWERLARMRRASGAAARAADVAVVSVVVA